MALRYLLLRSPLWPGCAVAALIRFQLDVAEHGIVLPAHFVLYSSPARRAAELAELHGVVDEALRVADQRAGRLDRAVDAVAVELVVLGGGAEGLAAVGAGQPVRAVAIHQIEVLGDRAQHAEARPGVRPRLAAEALNE